MSAHPSRSVAVTRGLVPAGDTVLSVFSLFVGTWSILVSVVGFSITCVAAGHRVDLMTGLYLTLLASAGIVACLGPVFVYQASQSARRFFTTTLAAAVLLNLLLVCAYQGPGAG